VSFWVIFEEVYLDADRILEKLLDKPFPRDKKDIFGNDGVAF